MQQTSNESPWGYLWRSGAPLPLSCIPITIRKENGIFLISKSKRKNSRKTVYLIRNNGGFESFIVDGNQLNTNDEMVLNNKIIISINNQFHYLFKFNVKFNKQNIQGLLESNGLKVEICKKNIIGSGCYGVVTRGIYINNSMKIPHIGAMKIINTSKYNNNNKKKQKIYNEFNIMSQLNHQNIVQAFGSVNTKNHHIIVMELLVGGNLKDFVENNKNNNIMCSEKNAASIMEQVYDALDYAHKKNIIHRDLKPENVLLCGDLPYMRIKLTDFGLAKQLSGNELTTNSACGTPNYMAPDLVCGIVYTNKVDMWSSGVLCNYILTHGRLIFVECEFDRRKIVNLMKQNYFNLSNANFPKDIYDHISKYAKQLIIWCLQRDPDRRPTAQQAKQQEWFQMVLFNNNNSNSKNENNDNDNDNCGICDKCNKCNKCDSTKSKRNNNINNNNNNNNENDNSYGHNNKPKSKKGDKKHNDNDNKK